jgi:alpha/beta superfamily hydrolase
MEMNGERVVFKSGALVLEGRLLLPPRAGVAGVVICHPHPLYGGSMDNNVVHAVSEALAKEGMAAFCFNFRGVGRSEGIHDGGLGEIDDTLAAISFLAGRREIHAGRIGLAGYSFGGTVALNTARQEGRVKAVAAISPPEVPDMGGYGRPRLILCGSEDSLIPASFILQQKEQITGPDGAGAVEVIPGADHFWQGHEEILAGRIASFFQQHLMAPAG